MNVRESICYQVTAALITVHGRLFIAQRPPEKKFGLCWEFPGGKVDPDESLEHCLQREIREELNWEIQVGELFEHIRHEQDTFRIDLFAFWSEVCGGRLELREHVACDWVSIPALHRYDFTEADRLLIQRLESLSALPDFPAPTTLDSREIYGICDPAGESPNTGCGNQPSEEP
jgi:8-oxo-dGTP diphosphatase